MHKRLIAALVAILASSSPALASDWDLIGVHVTLLEASYIPDHVTFQIDTNAGSCAAGSWLSWPGQGNGTASKQANVQAVYSMLLSAKLSNSAINVYGYTYALKTSSFVLKFADGSLSVEKANENLPAFCRDRYSSCPHSARNIFTNQYACRTHHLCYGA